MQKILISLAVLSLLIPSIASAKLYKCKDANGDVVYTDKECEVGKGKELKLKPFSTYKSNIVPVPPSVGNSKAEEDLAASYKLFKIIKPKNDKLISSNTGRVDVSYRLEGPLLSLKGHKFAIALDGKKLKTRGVTNQIRLNSVNPGTHTLQVFVLDAKDKVVKSSGQISFHMKHRNRLNSPTPGQPDQNQNAPGGDNYIPGGAGTIPGGSSTIPGGNPTPPN